MKSPDLRDFEHATKEPLFRQKRVSDIIRRGKKSGMLILAAAGMKGGSGKSTLVMNCAVGFEQKMRRVLIVDADSKQGTCRKWPRRANFGNTTVVGCEISRVAETIAESGLLDNTVVLIDLPGRDDFSLSDIFEIVDLALLPAKPSLLDLQELRHIKRVANAKGVPTITIFSEATRETTEELRFQAEKYAEYGPYLRIALLQLAGYRRAYPHGRGVLEYLGDNPAKWNFQRVFDALLQLIEPIEKGRRQK